MTKTNIESAVALLQAEGFAVFAMPAPTLLRNVNGQPVYLNWADLPASVLPHIMVNGAKIVLTNAFNGGGAETKGNDTVRLTQMQKRIDSWKRGEFIQVERGDNAYASMKEAFIDERRAATNASVKDVEANIAKTVKQVFGQDAKATFSQFLDAVATIKAKAMTGQEDALTMAEIRAKLEAKYAKLADDARKARDAASADLDMSDITFD